MALVSKVDVVAAIERMYVDEPGAVRWVKKSPAWYVNARGDMWAEHLQEAARGVDGEMSREELAKQAAEAVGSEIVECGTWKELTF